MCCYRPQTMFAKVMFSQVSVCPQGVCHIACWDAYPLGRHPSWADTAPVQCMLGYGQQAGGTHPTGMQSCLNDAIGPSAIPENLLSHLSPARPSTHEHLQPSTTDPPFRHSAAQTEQKYTRDQFRNTAKRLQ